MPTTQRLSAYPLVTSDPYCSIWVLDDQPAGRDTCHWTGARKRLTLSATIDGTPFSLLGSISGTKPVTAKTTVSPTKTTFSYDVSGLEITLSFQAPLLLDDWELLSMPITLIDISAKTADGKEHKALLRFSFYNDLCYNGLYAPEIRGDVRRDGALSIGWMGQVRQNLLCHSGDHVTIDWGYGYLAGNCPICYAREMDDWALTASLEATVGEETVSLPFMLAYDDVASIDYFGYISRAWYARSGMTLIQALRYCQQNRERIVARCEALDEDLTSRAIALGGKAYETLVCASYRHAISAHKLIADENQRPIFLSKENDSNGCIGTVDISYPSMPLFLLYSPELVRAMCTPVLRFASLPIWVHPFAPHDVGRYPHATGQVYALKRGGAMNGGPEKHGRFDVLPPIYQWAPMEEDIYNPRNQMPVEECGNMVLLVAAAMRADGDTAYARANLPLLTKWAQYLLENGRDPGEQLCTDDFAGHLARNVNLAFKATFAVAAFGWMLEKLGDEKNGMVYRKESGTMLQSIMDQARQSGYTSLTLDGHGWSLKYNAIWDLLFPFGMLDQAFFADELNKYRMECRQYSVPLDNRALYTKSDWQLWVAAMDIANKATGEFSEPIARYMAQTPTRFPFPDWYGTESGTYQSFIGRSVQGGIFMPLLREAWR